ncbi:hypothetical protein KI387_039004, partial [Taxus chinensis]
MEAHVSDKSFDPDIVEWTMLPNLCTNGIRYAENTNLTELSVTVVEDNLYAMKPQTNEVVQLRPESEQYYWTHFRYVGDDSELRHNCGINYKVLSVGSELWEIEYMMGKSIQIYSCK